jgi:hypothetical protein
MIPTISVIPVIQNLGSAVNDILFVLLRLTDILFVFLRPIIKANE